MLISIPHLVAYHSAQGYSAGDILTTGTISGVAAVQPNPFEFYLQPGDNIEAEIEGIGVLRNHVVPVAGQEQDGVGDVLRLPPAAERHPTRRCSRPARPGRAASAPCAASRVIAGLTALTRMPCGPPSTTSWYVSARAQPLAAPCAFCGMKNAPREAVIDATLTTEPPPAAIRCGQAARVTRKTMSSSFRMVKDQSA